MASKDRCYPPAKSGEWIGIDESKGIKNVKIMYHDRPGWISRYSRGQYPSTASKDASIPEVSMYSDNFEEYTYALTNGALWRYTAATKEVYVCPLHAKKMKNVRWSYLMNKKVGYVSYGSYDKADRALLFSEVPFIEGHGDWLPSGTGSSPDTDPVLDYEENETIGCNHKDGKNWFAHVVFVDGHTEKLRIPQSMSSTEMKELTEWLCTGTGIGFNGAKYDKLD